MSLSKTQQTVKDLDFSNVEELYAYISESYVVGQIKQAKRHFLALKKDERKECIEWLRVCCPNDEVHNFLVNLL